MKFNPDMSKQAVELIFSHKRKKPVHPSFTFNDIPVKRVSETKHAKTANKGRGLLKFLYKYTTRKRLRLMYKIYVHQTFYGTRMGIS